MSGTTTELALKTAADADDNADYLTLDLATSLRTLDALFNNVTGHNHSGAHQGGPITSLPAGAIPDGSITSIKIADGTIVGADIADRSIPYIKLTAPLGGDINFADGTGLQWTDVNTKIFSSSRHLFSDTYNANWYWRDTAAASVSRMVLTSQSGGTLIVGNAANVGQMGVSGAGAPSWAGYATGGPNSPGTITTPGGVLMINDSTGGAGDGGVLLFSANNEWYAGIKGFFTNGGNNGIGDLSFATRRSGTDTFLTEAMRITAAGVVDMSGSAGTIIKQPSGTTILGADTALPLNTNVTLLNVSVPAGIYLVTASVNVVTPTASTTIGAYLRSASGAQACEAQTAGPNTPAGTYHNLTLTEVITVGASDSLQLAARAANGAATAIRAGSMANYGMTLLSYVRIA